jgi:hypothetical protein
MLAIQLVKIYVKVLTFGYNILRVSVCTDVAPLTIGPI